MPRARGRRDAPAAQRDNVPGARPRGDGEPLQGGEPASSGEISRDALDALHVRLLTRDVVAPSELIALVLEPLIRALRRRAGNLLQTVGATMREDALNDAAEDACISYVKRPEQYDPSKAPGGLFPYLLMSAVGDLKNALPAIERRSRVLLLSLVELGDDRRNIRSAFAGGVSTAGGDIGDADDGHMMEQAMTAGLALMETDAERQVLRHMASGERRTAVFAEDLGLTALPPEEQRREVYRVKDKIKKRLARAGGTR